MSEETRGSMGVAGYITIFVVVIYLGFEVYGLHRARERMEPLAVYREFAGARRAAERCDPRPATFDDFERNFAAVTELALADLRSQDPGVDAVTVNATLQALTSEREAEVDALIDDGDCDGPDAWRLLKLYEVRSRLNLRPRGSAKTDAIS